MNDQSLFEAVNTYFDALYFCDVALLDKIFHPSSSLFDVDEGSILVDPIANFRQDVADRPSPASCKQERDQEILMVDLLSKNCATVKVRLRAHTNVFVDHLNFVRDTTGWRIVSKVWHLERVIETNS